MCLHRKFVSVSNPGGGGGHMTSKRRLIDDDAMPLRHIDVRQTSLRPHVPAGKELERMAFSVNLCR